jgi:DNA end-binding protein Ku
MARAIATSQIAFGLVSIPVKLFSAAETSEKISFNMLHGECGGRVQQQLFCPKDDRTVERAEVVKGYEFARGQYVLFNDEELKALEEKSTQQIEIVEFLPKEKIDPIYFSKGYYLAPDRGGDRAYTLLAKALEQTGRWALAKYSVRGRQHLVVLRPAGKGLVMQQLFYANEIRSMEELEVGEAVVKENELKMAIQLAEMGAAEEFHPENYRDEVTDRTRALIERKIAGEEITSAGEQEPKAQVIDLMEALKASLAGPRNNNRDRERAQEREARGREAAPASTKGSKAKPTVVKAEQSRKPAKPAAREVVAAKAKAR